MAWQRIIPPLFRTSKYSKVLKLHSPTVSSSPLPEAAPGTPGTPPLAPLRRRPATVHSRVIPTAQLVQEATARPYTSLLLNFWENIVEALALFLHQIYHGDVGGAAGQARDIPWEQWMRTFPRAGALCGIQAVSVLLSGRSCDDRRSFS